MTDIQLDALIRISLNQFANIDEYQANTIILAHRPVLNQFRGQWAIKCILNNKISF